ncbi:MAG: transposase [Candidatus Acidiferrales bacterium]|jgi:REP element-mobilizing transposase RayT
MDRIRRRRTLPHWETDRAIYFVTFRLAGSIPKEALARLCTNLRPAPNRISDAPQQLQNRPLHARVEKFLDSGAGACYLARPDVAALVSNALGIFAGLRYRLFAWCLMPNHLHAVIEPIGEWNLASIIHTWKSFTANRANQLLARTGEFWQREYYDHQVRNGEDYSRIIRYVLENPSKAGLVNWPWVGTKPWSPQRPHIQS